jgi:tetratricopeptide (TPR) repeat protein
MKHPDYNLTLIKPLAGMGASKASGASDEKERRRVDMKLLDKRLALAAMMALTIVALGCSRHSSVNAQETDDPVKIEIYKRFVDNRIQNPVVAYQAARDYLNKYNKDKDQYTDYLNKWTAAYERDERKRNLPIYINEKKFTEAYATGAKILADEPNYLRAQIDLGYAGYLASSAKNEQFNTTALDYARTAIQAIESGKSPTEWAPFKGKDDTLAYLNYAVGYLTLKTTPDQAIDYLIKAAQYESDIKKTPSTYYFLAVAYESGPYKTLSAAYQKDFADKPETPASKAALEKLGLVMDRIVDAYARAIAAAGTDPKTQQSRTEWTAQMTTYYKFRHNNSDAGLTEFISSALQRPLPPKP